MQLNLGKFFFRLRQNLKINFLKTWNNYFSRVPVVSISLKSCFNNMNFPYKDNTENNTMWLKYLKIE